jgi:hypothetical protein
MIQKPNNFRPKLLSYRQATVLRHVHNKINLDTFISLYRCTGMSLFSRGYLEVNWTQETVSLTPLGEQELSAYFQTPLGLMKVKHNPSDRQVEFRGAIPRKKVTVLKKTA